MAAGSALASQPSVWSLYDLVVCLACIRGCDRFLVVCSSACILCIRWMADCLAELVCCSGGLSCAALIFLINAGESSFTALRPAWTRPHQCVFAAKQSSCDCFYQFARGCRLCAGVGVRVGGPVLLPWGLWLQVPRSLLNLVRGACMTSLFASLACVVAVGSSWFALLLMLYACIGRRIFRLIGVWFRWVGLCYFDFFNKCGRGVVCRPSADLDAFTSVRFRG